MLLSYFDYFLTIWSPAGMKKTNPLEVLCKEAIKVVDKKPRHYHHCAISKKIQSFQLEPSSHIYRF